MTKTNRTAATVVADICLYGTTWTGAGWLAQAVGGQMFGNGEPVKDRTMTEAMWHAQHALRQANVPNGIVRVFAPGGERMALIGLNEAAIFGGLTWQNAPVYQISAEALIAASEVAQ